tara:strand:+ start:3982 stop:4152 length:171 start_codon:yes stop_codon:yes gene_type:complete
LGFTTDTCAVLLAATASQRLEGLIAQRVDSMHRLDLRAKGWTKIRNLMVVELVVGG